MFRFIKRLFVDTPPAEAVSKSSSPAAPPIQPPKTAAHPAPPSTPAPARASSGPSLHIPLKSIVDRLPEALLARIERAPAATETIALPLSTATEQLPRGVVRISFGDLKR